MPNLNMDFVMAHVSEVPLQAGLGACHQVAACQQGGMTLRCRLLTISTWGKAVFLGANVIQQLLQIKSSGHHPQPLHLVLATCAGQTSSAVFMPAPCS